MEAIRKRWSFGRWSVLCELGFAKHWEARFSVDEEDATISVGVPYLGVYVSLEGPGCRSDEARSIGVSSLDGHIHWSVWTNPMHWSSTTPRWRDGGVEFIDLFLGKCDIRIDDVAARTVWVPMIERSYLATATVKRHVRRWPRWPWPKTTTFIDITMADGHLIPIPGKGENSYDCDEDGLYAMSTPAKTIEDAIGRVVADVLVTRKRRGWTSWDPPTPADTLPPEPATLPPVPIPGMNWGSNGVADS